MIEKITEIKMFKSSKFSTINFMFYAILKRRLKSILGKKTSLKGLKFLQMSFKILSKLTMVFVFRL